MSGVLNHPINAEYWVCRVLQPASAPRDSRVRMGLVSGAFHEINGDIVEPVRDFAIRDFASQEGAQEAATIHAQKEHARTGMVHKVVLNAEL